MIWKLKGNKTTKTFKDEIQLHAIGQIFTIPFCVFLIGIITTGIMFGVQDTFLFLYFQEDLDASSKFVSNYIYIAFTSQALFLPFSDKVVNFLGCINSLFLHIVVDVFRLIAYGFIKSKPPYFAYGLACLNFTMWSLSYVAVINYGYKITPPQLIGTMTAVLVVTEFVICKLMSK